MDAGVERAGRLESGRRMRAAVERLGLSSAVSNLSDLPAKVSMCKLHQRQRSNMWTHSKNSGKYEKLPRGGVKVGFRVVSKPSAG